MHHHSSAEFDPITYVFLLFLLRTVGSVKSPPNKSGRQVGSSKCSKPILVSQEPRLPSIGGNHRAQSLITTGIHPKLLVKTKDSLLNGKLELLPLHDTSIVDPEEVTVQDSLDDARNNRNPVHPVAPVSVLGHVAVDPIGDVQSAVQTQGEDVVRGDGLGLSRALEHKQLGQDGDALEPDRESPRDLPERVFIGHQEGEDGGASEEILHAEGVEGRVVGRLVGVGHQVDDVPLRAEEEDLEDDVIDGLGVEEVEVARDVDYHVETLRFE